MKPQEVVHQRAKELGSEGLLLLLLPGLQQEQHAVEGEQEEAALLVEEQQRVRVLRRLREDPSQALNAQLITHVPHTQHLHGCEEQKNGDDVEGIMSSDYTGCNFNTPPSFHYFMLLPVF